MTAEGVVDEFDFYQITATPTKAKRIQASYGFWSTLLKYLEPYQQLTLQALNHLSYNVSISRV